MQHITYSLNTKVSYNIAVPILLLEFRLTLFVLFLSQLIDKQLYLKKQFDSNRHAILASLNYILFIFCSLNTKLSYNIAVTIELPEILSTLLVLFQNHKIQQQQFIKKKFGLN